VYKDETLIKVENFLLPDGTTYSGQMKKGFATQILGAGSRSGSQQ
jgi:hypothetical protein